MPVSNRLRYLPTVTVTNTIISVLDNKIISFTLYNKLQLLLTFSDLVQYPRKIVHLYSEIFLKVKLL